MSRLLPLIVFTQGSCSALIISPEQRQLLHRGHASTTTCRRYSYKHGRAFDAHTNLLVAEQASRGRCRRCRTRRCTRARCRRRSPTRRRTPGCRGCPGASSPASRPPRRRRPR
uniref:Uncharacterized protein n=1 Tax=Zea mays TaxID=4577 RepID=C0PM14_MAIZE|nr:unknown [Zea mays]ACR35298.1 unknown [Zea mays]ACR36188.1 unknown [Zea mays]